MQREYEVKNILIQALSISVGIMLVVSVLLIGITVPFTAMGFIYYWLFKLLGILYKKGVRNETRNQAAK